MPVILPREKRQAWLDSATDPETLKSFLAPYPAEKMRGYAVSKAVSNSRNERPELIKPAVD